MGFIYHWDSMALRCWKNSTPHSILIRAYKICSAKELLDEVHNILTADLFK